MTAPTPLITATDRAHLQTHATRLLRTISSHEQYLELLNAEYDQVSDCLFDVDPARSFAPTAPPTAPPAHKATILPFPRHTK